MDIIGSTTMFLSDNVVQQLIGTSAFKIIHEHGHDNRKNIPPVRTKQNQRSRKEDGHPDDKKFDYEQCSSDNY